MSANGTAPDDCVRVRGARENNLRDVDVNIPRNALAVAGTMDWLRGTESFALTVSTPEPLHFDATCDAAQRVDAGEMHAAGTFGDLTGYVRVRWGDCGDEPTIDFVEGGE